MVSASTSTTLNLTAVQSSSQLTAKKRKISETHLNTISESDQAKFKVLKKLHIQGTKTNHHISYLTRSGILAVKDVLETRSNKEPKTWILPRSLYFVLTKTCFKFYDRFCKQISGIAMGTKCAPSYTIIFMDKFEREFLARYPLSHMVWWRYIDDVFMICSREELYFFINGLNNSHLTLRFTSDVSETTVNFLDVRITKDASGRIQTSLYSKPLMPTYIQRRVKMKQQRRHPLLLRRESMESLHELCSNFINILNELGSYTLFLLRTVKILFCSIVYYSTYIT